MKVSKQVKEDIAKAVANSFGNEAKVYVPTVTRWTASGVLSKRSTVLLPSTLASRIYTRTDVANVPLSKFTGITSETNVWSFGILSLLIEADEREYLAQACLHMSYWKKLDGIQSMKRRGSVAHLTAGCCAGQHEYSSVGQGAPEYFTMGADWPIANAKAVEGINLYEVQPFGESSSATVEIEQI